MLLFDHASIHAAAVGASTPDPWAWSLDSVIASAGVLATLAVAVVGGVYAVGMTRRRDNEDQRQRRARLASAIDRYVEARQSSIALQEHKAMWDAAVAEGFSSTAPEIEWVERHAEDVMVLFRDMPRGKDGSPLEHSWWLAYGKRVQAIRQRLYGWVATGTFDLTEIPLEFGADGKPVL